MGMKRLTYDVRGKHYCDYPTREIINHLAECEIMLEKIQQILKDHDADKMPEDYWYIDRISEVLEDGKID